MRLAAATNSNWLTEIIGIQISDFPGHEHASLYDIGKIPGAVTRYLTGLGVDIRFKTRITKITKDGDRITEVISKQGDAFAGDVFIDTTGTAGPMNNCVRYGNGCAMCVLRCPSFGGRVSLAGLAGVKEMQGIKPDGAVGAMSGSCKLYKESLSPEIVELLDRDGVAVVPIPAELVENHLDIKACQQYALAEFAENVILLDTGHAKLMTPTSSLSRLQKIPGFENANTRIHMLAARAIPCDISRWPHAETPCRSEGVENLFCAVRKRVYWSDIQKLSRQALWLLQRCQAGCRQGTAGSSP